jgi:hypothetical protein
MRTLVGAAEPEPRPAVFYPTVTTNVSSVSYTMSFVEDEPVRPPIRTTAWVEKPVGEIEQ